MSTHSICFLGEIRKKVCNSFPVSKSLLDKLALSIYLFVDK